MNKRQLAGKPLFLNDLYFFWCTALLSMGKAGVILHKAGSACAMKVDVAAGSLGQ
ncbi:hypothetical protein [Advenella sp. FME57]|uniref:hypothetical protein n=1 Tax=Advenella sp. FME57 TaxID=2742604 RepID=UPI0018669DF2|nr:hypothetical protein [Advenella sp. FME57]